MSAPDGRSALRGPDRSGVTQPLGAIQSSGLSGCAHGGHSEVNLPGDPGQLQRWSRRHDSVRSIPSISPSQLSAVARKRPAVVHMMTQSAGITVTTKRKHLGQSDGACQVRQDLTQLAADALRARRLIQIRAQNLLRRCLRQ
jgi:hypothetical protein